MGTPSQLYRDKSHHSWGKFVNFYSYLLWIDGSLSDALMPADDGSQVLTALTVTKKLLQELIPRFGLPLSQSDSGLTFTGKVSPNLTKVLNVD